MTHGSQPMSSRRFWPNERDLCRETKPGWTNALMRGRGESGSFYSGGQIASQGEKHRALLEALEGFLHIERRRAVPGEDSPNRERGWYVYWSVRVQHGCSLEMGRCRMRSQKAKSCSSCQGAWMIFCLQGGGGDIFWAGRWHDLVCFRIIIRIRLFRITEVAILWTPTMCQTPYLHLLI